MGEYIVRETGFPGQLKQEVVGEIVRCKDCKHWEKEFRECYSPNWDTGKDDLFVTPSGFYCGWGERREDE